MSSDPANTIQSTLMFSEHFRVTIMVAFTTIMSIVGMGALGYYTDLALGSHPKVLIAFLVLSFPVSQVVIYKWVKDHYVPDIKKKSQASHQ